MHELRFQPQLTGLAEMTAAMITDAVERAGFRLADG